MKKQGNNTEWQRDGTFSAYVISEVIARTRCHFEESRLQKRRLKICKGLRGQRLKQENTAVRWKANAIYLGLFQRLRNYLITAYMHLQ